MATPTKKRSTSSSKRPTPGIDRRALERSLKRLNQSIEAAEAAGKDLRSGVAKGSKALVRDLERTLKHARTNARDVGKAVTKDLKDALAADSANGRRAAPARKAKAGSARKPAASKTAGSKTGGSKATTRSKAAAKPRAASRPKAAAKPKAASRSKAAAKPKAAGRSKAAAASKPGGRTKASGGTRRTAASKK